MHIHLTRFGRVAEKRQFSLAFGWFECYEI